MQMRIWEKMLLSQADALTVNPWLGIDSLEPFFKKASETSSGLFILVHTSNNGSKDIQESNSYEWC